MIEKKTHCLLVTVAKKKSAVEIPFVDDHNRILQRPFYPGLAEFIRGILLTSQYDVMTEGIKEGSYQGGAPKEWLSWSVYNFNFIMLLVIRN